MNSYGYRPYRGGGRRGPSAGGRGRAVLKGIIAALALLLAVCVGLWIWLQQYIVYTDQGVVLDLPWAREEPQESETPPPLESEDPLESGEVVVEDPLPSPSPAPAWFHGVQLPVSVLAEGSALDQLSQWEGNALIFDMKTDGGSLSYVSSVPLAVSSGASGSDPAVNQAVAALAAQEEVWLVARLSCFEDNVVGMDHDLAILTNSGYRWQGPDDNRWINPTHAAVRQYVTDLCVEMAEMGFDEILLDNAGFPTQGNLGWIRVGESYDASQFSTLITAFYDQVEAALAPYGVRLSIAATAAALEGSDTLSGQTADNLLSSGRRIWVAEGEGVTAQTLSALGMTDGAERLVTLRSAAGGEEEHWALMYH